MRLIAVRRIAFAVGLFAACGGGKDDEAPTPLPKCTAPVAGTKITAKEITKVAGSAVLVTAPREDPRLFVVEQQGRIRIVDETGALLPAPFLDITEGYELAAGGEQGLLGLAFHPQYFKNGQYFIFYTTTTANVLARCAADPANKNASAGACTTVLSIPDFASNHNGGMIEFGPDGYLYIGTGDGGGGGDPHRNGQSLLNGAPQANSIALLGKMLRIDVDHQATGLAYDIPRDNPYATGGGAPEIFMLGFRNPWRWAFDKETGDLWVGDVGQDLIEELDAVPHGQQNGKNFGWSMYEADSCYYEPCSATGKVFPQDTRTHADGWVAIIGGDVYRGSCYPDITGWHFYTDNGAGGLYRAKLKADGTIEKATIDGAIPNSVSSIHGDARGELYMTTTDGSVYHLEAGI